MGNLRITYGFDPADEAMYAEFIQHLKDTAIVTDLVYSDAELNASFTIPIQ